MNNRNNRATRAIVASGSLLAIIAIGIPWVDEYLRHRRDAAEMTELQVELVDAQQRDSQLQKMEEKLASELDSLSARSVDATKKESVRETLVEIVRQAGGRLRQLEIADGPTRSWARDDDDPRLESMPEYGEESDFVLHTHTVSLRADGSLESVRRIIADVGQHGWLMTTRSLTAMPTGVRESPVTLEMNVVLYGLGPRPNEPEDDLARLDPSTRIR